MAFALLATVAVLSWLTWSRHRADTRTTDAEEDAASVLDALLGAVGLL